MAKSHVGRPTNEEVAARKRKKILKILITCVLIGVLVVLISTKVGLRGIMGNVVDNDYEYYCEDEDFSFNAETNKCVKESLVKSMLLGNIVDDGYINQDDVNLLRGIIDNTVEYTNLQYNASDVNDDGFVNDTDYELLAAYATGYIAAPVYAVSATIGKVYVCPSNTSKDGAKISYRLKKDNNAYCIETIEKEALKKLKEEEPQVEQEEIEPGDKQVIQDNSNSNTDNNINVNTTPSTGKTCVINTDTNKIDCNTTDNVYYEITSSSDEADEGVEVEDSDNQSESDDTAYIEKSSNYLKYAAENTDDIDINIKIDDSIIDNGIKIIKVKIEDVGNLILSAPTKSGYIFDGWTVQNSNNDYLCYSTDDKKVSSGVKWSGECNSKVIIKPGNNIESILKTVNTNETLTFQSQWIVNSNVKVILKNSESKKTVYNRHASVYLYNDYTTCKNDVTSGKRTKAVKNGQLGYIQKRIQYSQNSARNTGKITFSRNWRTKKTYYVSVDPSSSAYEKYDKCVAINYKTKEQTIKLRPKQFAITFKGNGGNVKHSSFTKIADIDLELRESNIQATKQNYELVYWTASRRYTDPKTNETVTQYRCYTNGIQSNNRRKKWMNAKDCVFGKVLYKYETLKDNNGKKYKGLKIQIDAQASKHPEIIYTAYWKKVRFKVTLNGNGGNVSKKSIMVTSGGTYKELSNIKVTRTNHKFHGWTTDGDQPITSATKVMDKDITLYAGWEYVPPKKVSTSSSSSSNVNKTTTKKTTKTKTKKKTKQTKTTEKKENKWSESSGSGNSTPKTTKENKSGESSGSGNSTPKTTSARKRFIGWVVVTYDESDPQCSRGKYSQYPGITRNGNICKSVATKGTWKACGNKKYSKLRDKCISNEKNNGCTPYTYNNENVVAKVGNKCYELYCPAGYMLEKSKGYCVHRKASGGSF